MTAKRKNTKKDIIRITELVQECLDNLAERHYYKSPHEDKTITNLKEVITISERWLSG
tara:strand:+ start:361 stop:534 length:174 start_codon:yes stop_codon:yes gene_type:complete